MTSVLVLDKFADVYERELKRRFPGLAIHKAATMADIAVDPARVDALFAFGIAIDDGLIARATNLKWIASLATGVDHFLRCPSLRHETILTSARGIHGPAMRETVATLMLSLSRDVARLVTNKAAHRWDRGERWPLLAGRTAVVVGIGVSGIAIGELLKAFGMRLIGVTRTPRPIAGFDAMMPTAQLARAAAEADFLINVLPGSEENRGIFSRAVLTAMKPDAFFINVGRGETVDEAALIEALRSGRIAGAGLDVFQHAPLKPDSPFWDLPNVVISPQIGGYFVGYEEQVIPLLMENMRLFLAGRLGEMQNVVAH
ncbi:MAG TPA: D-2-hydroxyacid dehydrogenase [Xanthobacteraceae bacterium]|nr:D-2-hydroxyacid dehydrogenase [Xanthobacteraceae bacterium]